MACHPSLSNILPFPAKTCSFYVNGRCINHPLTQSEVDKELRCQVLSLWERLQDEGLEIADDQSLDEGDAMQAMAERLRPAQDLELICTRYQPDGRDAALDCIFFHGHLCIHSLPCCGGACSHFSSRTGRPETAFY